MRCSIQTRGSTCAALHGVSKVTRELAIAVVLRKWWRQSFGGLHRVTYSLLVLGLASRHCRLALEPLDWNDRFQPRVCLEMVISSKSTRQADRSMMQEAVVLRVPRARNQVKKQERLVEGEVFLEASTPMFRSKAIWEL